MAASTQETIPISDIQDGIIMLKNGNAAVVLKTTAVNFGLLSEEEQMAIIGSFAQMLNSLNFPIQIIIRSSRLDISSYLILLDKALQLQTNPLLAQMMLRYREFVQSLIKDNEVLDKRFYVVVSVSSLELGLKSGGQDKLKKAQTVLLPRRDQIIRQLARVGLKAEGLDTQATIKLLFDLYNPKDNGPTLNQQAPQQTQAQSPTTFQTPNTAAPVAQTPLNSIQQQPMNIQPRQTRSHPFVVEELTP